MLYLITYDLKLPPQNYCWFHDTVQALGPTCFRCMENMWLLKTDFDVEICADRLDPYLDTNDRLLVIDITHQSIQGMLPQRVWDWIKANDE